MQSTSSLAHTSPGASTSRPARPRGCYREYALKESGDHMLSASGPTESDELLDMAQRVLDARYRWYEELVSLPGPPSNPDTSGVGGHGCRWPAGTTLSAVCSLLHDATRPRDRLFGSRSGSPSRRRASRYISSSSSTAAGTGASQVTAGGAAEYASSKENLQTGCGPLSRSHR